MTYPDFEKVVSEFPKSRILLVKRSTIQKLKLWLENLFVIGHQQVEKKILDIQIAEISALFLSVRFFGNFLSRKI